MRGVLDTNDKEIPQLKFISADSPQENTVILAGDDEPALLLRTPDDSRVVMLSTKSGAHGLALVDKSQLRVSLSVFKNQGSSLDIWDSEGKKQITLGQDPSEGPSLDLEDTDGYSATLG